MQNVTFQTLLLEMQLCEMCGELLGKTEQEQYQYYVNRYLADWAYRKELYKTYPVMYSEILRLLQCSFCNVIEILRCFEKDRQELK